MPLRMSPKLGLLIIAAFTIVLLVAFVTLDHMAPAGRRLVKVKGEDPVSYFAIAHSMLFDRDFDQTNEFEHVPPAGRFWSATRPETGLPGSPWGLGYSFLSMPLLAIGTGIDAMVGNPADGYSAWAMFFYCIGNVLITGCGMAVLFSLLWRVAEYWEILPVEHQSVYGLFVTFVVFFGTNVGYYAFSEMSHASTFLCASLFLLTWWRVRDSARWQDWLILGLAGGFLSISRWQDVLYLGGPGLYDLFGGEPFKKPLAWLRSRSFYVLGIAICWAPQLMEWKAIYGKYLTIPQGGGIFSFPPAHMMQVLMSTQVGWFIWTPVTLLGVIGLFLGASKAPRIYLPWIIVLTLQVAVVGSIPFWNGVESFGARYMLSNTPLVGFGIITFYGVSTVWVRRSLALVCAVFCAFTVLFAIQFRLDLVPRETPLTFSELVTDKLRLWQVRQRKAAVRQAREFLAKGDAASAVQALQAVLPLGEDRDVDMVLEQAYRAAGNTEQADVAQAKYKRFLESKLY